MKDASSSQAFPAISALKGTPRAVCSSRSCCAPSPQVPSLTWIRPAAGTEATWPGCSSQPSAAPISKATDAAIAVG